MKEPSNEELRKPVEDWLDRKLSLWGAKKLQAFLEECGAINAWPDDPDDPDDHNLIDNVNFRVCIRKERSKGSSLVHEYFVIYRQEHTDLGLGGYMIKNIGEFCISREMALAIYNDR